MTRHSLKDLATGRWAPSSSATPAAFKVAAAVGKKMSAAAMKKAESLARSMRAKAATAAAKKKAAAAANKKAVVVAAKKKAVAAGKKKAVVAAGKKAAPAAGRKAAPAAGRSKMQAEPSSSAKSDAVLYLCRECFNGDHDLCRKVTRGEQCGCTGPSSPARSNIRSPSSSEYLGENIVTSRTALISAFEAVTTAMQQNITNLSWKIESLTALIKEGKDKKKAM